MSGISGDVFGAPRASSPIKYYAHCFRDEVADKAFEWIWKSKCTNKWKVFSWLLLADRLNTHNLLKRKGMKLWDDDYTCLLCSTQLEETVEHLFFECEFSKMCWGSWRSRGQRMAIGCKKCMRSGASGPGLCSWKLSSWRPGASGKSVIIKTSEGLSLQGGGGR